MLTEVSLDISSQAPAKLDQDALWFVSCQGQLMVCEDPALPLLPEFRSPGLLGMDDLPMLYAGRLGEQHCFTLVLDDPARVPPGYYLEDLRRLLGQLDESLFAMAGRALQLAVWYVNHRFCSRCGSPVGNASVWPAECSACGYTQYPRITPCVIVLVTRGEQALLARAARFPRRMFSCLAGFMEAGENAEHAVHREVFEETALRLGEVRYYGSQSWPFPHALMLGFRAEHSDGEIQVDGEEIVEAHWWHHSELPPVPPQGSIARALIDDWRSGFA